jgi:hypothetical protein
MALAPAPTHITTGSGRFMRNYCLLGACSTIGIVLDTLLFHLNVTTERGNVLFLFYRVETEASKH